MLFVPLVLAALVRQERQKAAQLGAYEVGAGGAQRAPEDALCEAATLEACEALGGGRKQLQEMMQSDDADTEAFLAAAGLGPGFSCRELCAATLRFAQTPSGGGLKLPPAPGVACADADCAVQEPLGPQECAELAAKELYRVQVVEELRDMGDVAATRSQLSAGGGGAAAEGLHERPPDHLQLEADPKDIDQVGEPERLRFAPAELGRQLLAVFDVHPVPPDAPGGFLGEGSLLEEEGPGFGSKVRKDRYREYTLFAARGAALLATAIRRVVSHRNVVETWFGKGVPLNRVREMFQRMLKTMLNMKIKVGTECGGRTLAYVYTWSNPFTGGFWKSEKSGGEYVVNMCEHFWKTQAWDESYRYGTLIHESAHHHGPTDVTLANGQTAYGERNNLKLVREQGPHGDGSAEQGTLNNADNYMTCALKIASDQMAAPLAAWNPDGHRNGHLPAEKCNTACGAAQFEGAAFASVGSGVFLNPDQCAHCEWVTKEAFFGDGCGGRDAFTIDKGGFKGFFKDVCCRVKTCSRAR